MFSFNRDPRGSFFTRLLISSCQSDLLLSFFVTLPGIHLTTFLSVLSLIFSSWTRALEALSMGASSFLILTWTDYFRFASWPEILSTPACPSSFPMHCKDVFPARLNILIFALSSFASPLLSSLMLRFLFPNVITCSYITFLPLRLACLSINMKRTHEAQVAAPLSN